MHQSQSHEVEGMSSLGNKYTHTMYACIYRHAHKHRHTKMCVIVRARVCVVCSRGEKDAPSTAAAALLFAASVWPGTATILSCSTKVSCCVSREAWPARHTRHIVRCARRAGAAPPVPTDWLQAARGWARALARERVTALRTGRNRVCVGRAGHAVAVKRRRAAEGEQYKAFDRDAD